MAEADPAIVAWLAGGETGLSSKAIALVALGADADRFTGNYPHDAADFGRCHKLLAVAPAAHAGLAGLYDGGGPYWRALTARWADLADAYAADPQQCRALLRSILDPIEDEDRGIIRLGEGVSVRFGRP